MKKKNVLYLLLVLILPLSYTILGSNSGGITGKSTSSCTPCHGNAQNTATSISVTGIPTSGFMAGQNYTMTLVVANSSYTGSPNRAGFNLTVNSGALTAGTGMNLSGTQELSHSTPITMSNTGSATWTFDWTAPTSPSGPVIFSVAGNATNGNFNSNGDAHNATATTFQVASTVSPPTITNVTQSAIMDISATIGAMINANNASTTGTVEYGLTTSYGSNASMTPASITGSTATAATANLTGLLPNTTYHFRVSATNSAGTSNSTDATFKTNFASQIVDFGKGTFEIYPNPTRGNLKIEVEENIQMALVSLYTLTGSKVGNVHSSFHKNIISLDVSNKPSGIYLLHLKLNGKSIIEKLFIQ